MGATSYRVFVFTLLCRCDHLVTLSLQDVRHLLRSVETNLCVYGSQPFFGGNSFMREPDKRSPPFKQIQV